MATVYLGIGTNLGNKSENLNCAINLLKEQAGTVLACSSFMCSEAWGFESPNAFLNAVLNLDTQYSPEELLHITQSIEQKMGRTHKTTNGIYTDRIIDIDILLYDDLVIEAPFLTIPHPYILHRDFVYKPLLEIAPDIIHPKFKESVHSLISKK